MNTIHGKDKSVSIIPKNILKNQYTLSAGKSFSSNIEGSSSLHSEVTRLLAPLFMYIFVNFLIILYSSRFLMSIYYTEN